MDKAQLFLEYTKVLAWPLIALTALLLYKKIITGLVPGSKVKFTLSGFSIETSLPVIEQSVTDSLDGQTLTEEELALLKKLRNDGRITFERSATNIKMARSLRNAGLIKHYPRGGFLQDARQIEITILGRLLVEAVDKAKV
jgi:hypothetical protein